LLGKDKHDYVWAQGAVTVYGMLNSLPTGAGKQRAKAAVIQALDQGILDGCVPNAAAMLKIATQKYESDVTSRAVDSQLQAEADNEA
jgi:hypothetical protein